MSSFILLSHYLYFPSPCRSMPTAETRHSCRRGWSAFLTPRDHRPASITSREVNLSIEKNHLIKSLLPIIRAPALVIIIPFPSSSSFMFCVDVLYRSSLFGARSLRHRHDTVGLRRQLVRFRAKPLLQCLPRILAKSFSTSIVARTSRRDHYRSYAQFGRHVSTAPYFLSAIALPYTFLPSVH
ncbi:hypothetical protein EVG20_g10197 [Dentipellis fragilis]|uniref:Uncharacterized protein n=1 Tax=Dentipellis fragilis TaxID=205917 RepID=A0A4Y9XT86_9AGAM|nr:hypothetical protein EVG20_g10197 [Dentipellis fragilis]